MADLGQVWCQWAFWDLRVCKAVRGGQVRGQTWIPGPENGIRVW